MKNIQQLAPQLVLVLLFNFSSQSQHQGYFIRDEFSVLSVEISHRISVHRDFHCGMYCLRVAGCRSYNVATEKRFQDGRFDCQLLNSTKTEHNNATPSKYYHHFTRIMTLCERNNPCLSGSTCVAVDLTGFECLCPKAYDGKLCDKVKWLKINSSPVCFGAKNDSFGQFNITVPGFIITFKLVHVSGLVTCNKDFPLRYSNWGCRNSNGNPERMNTVITYPNDKRILPQDEFLTINRERLEYNLPGYDEMSKEIVFKNISVSLWVRGGDKFRIWYGQDLTNALESNNDGTTCCDVYGLYE